MATIKQKVGEDFSKEKVERVIEMLEKGATKKTCCAFLGMSYNTARLAKIITSFKDKEDFLAKQKKLLRGTPVSKTDQSYIVQAYLNNEAIINIADNIYRSANIVKNVLTRYGVPLRKPGSNYFDPVFIDQDPVDDYETGDLVFSARYNTVAEICKKMDDSVYRIHIQGKNEQYAYQPTYELADLRKIQKELKVKIEFLDQIEVNYLLSEAMKKANKAYNKEKK